MDTALGWIGELAKFIGTLFPRLLIVDRRSLGVAFRRGKYPKILLPGLHVYWPFWTRVESWLATWQVTRLAARGLTTSDGETIAVEASIDFRVRAPMTAFVYNGELHEQIPAAGLGVLARYVAEHTFSEAQDSGNLCDLQAAMAERLRAYGVEVRSTELTGFARGIVLLHVGQSRAVGALLEE